VSVKCVRERLSLFLRPVGRRPKIIRQVSCIIIVIIIIIHSFISIIVIIIIFFFLDTFLPVEEAQ